jgi:hypothetical protein
MRSVAARLQKLEAKAPPEYGFRAIVWCVVTADNGRPAEDQGELLGYEFRVGPHTGQVLRAIGESEEDLLSRAIETVTPLGPALPTFIELRTPSCSTRQSE